MNILTERWIAIDGSVYTERAMPKKTESTGKLMETQQRDSVAFNVGPKVAAHMVKLHNESLSVDIFRGLRYST